MTASAPTSSRLAVIANVLALAGGGAAIAAAWGFQLIGGYIPCKLCLEQRIPYYVGLPLALLALAALVMRRYGVATLLLLTVALVFVYGAGLGIYQAGAEWQFWPGPVDCGGGTGAPTSAANMLQALQTARVVSCTEASWRMLGLSFAGWNVVASAGVAMAALLGALFSRKAQKGS